MPAGGSVVLGTDDAQRASDLDVSRAHLLGLGG